MEVNMWVVPSALNVNVIANIIGYIIDIMKYKCVVAVEEMFILETNHEAINRSTFRADVMTPSGAHTIHSNFHPTTALDDNAHYIYPSSHDHSHFRIFGWNVVGFNTRSGELSFRGTSNQNLCPSPWWVVKKLTRQ